MDTQKTHDKDLPAPDVVTTPDAAGRRQDADPGLTARHAGPTGADTDTARTRADAASSTDLTVDEPERIRSREDWVRDDYRRRRREEKDGIRAARRLKKTQIRSAKRERKSAYRAVKKERKERIHAAKTEKRAQLRALKKDLASARQTLRRLTPRRIRLDVHGREKPALRGWLHAGAAPLALAGGIVLICLAPTTGLKWACAVYMACSLILFANSAVYHIGDWDPTVTALLRRFDHANIFLLVAGTYTPVAFALEPRARTLLLVAVWTFAILSVLIITLWIRAPRWLSTLVYVLFGVSGVVAFPLFWRSPVAGPSVVWLIAAGGIAYIIGAVVYALRKPDPWPRVYGFHEIFHTLTIAAYACHMVAIFLVVCRLR